MILPNPIPVLYTQCDHYSTASAAGWSIMESPQLEQLIIGDITFSKSELLALKELLKSTNPELYI